MRQLLLTLCFITITSVAYTQSTDGQTAVAADSIQRSIDAISQKNALLVAREDSLKQILGDKKASFDSIQNSFHHRTDSVTTALHSDLNKLNAAGTILQSKIDSLRARDLNTDAYTHKLDSVDQKANQTLAAAGQKIESIKSKAMKDVQGLNLPPDVQNKISGITKNIEGFKLPSSGLNLPSLKLNTDLNLPSLSQFNVQGLKPSSLPAIASDLKLPGVKEELSKLGDVKDITKVTSEVGMYSKEIQSATTGNLKGVTTEAEKQAAQATGLNTITDQTKVLDQYKGQLAQVQNPEAAKEQAIQQVQQQVQQQAVNHFAGHEQALQQAMDKVAKYKRRYSSLSSLDEVKKWKIPNGMKGKPLRERIFPSVSLQIQRKGDLMLDFSPYMGYRVSGRWNAGLGWNQRIAYNNHNYQFGHHNTVYGPRMYTEFNVFKGYFPRIEIEAMNTFVPPFGSALSEATHRQWVGSAFFGLKKGYRFFKNVNGYSIIMVNLYNPHLKSPYGDTVTMRIGFEFMPKPKKNR